MDVLAWTLQIAAAVIFLYSGSLKSWMPKDRMIATGQTGVAPYPLPVLRIVAVSELFGAVGLVLPWLLDTGRVLTPVAAACLVPIMIGAAVAHAHLGELKQVFLVNLPLLAALLAVVAIRVADL
jgi:uncharacterized membrane protein YphA (DoxX/SURF4 family)